MTDGVFSIPLDVSTEDGETPSAVWPLREYVGDAENALVSAAVESLLAPTPRCSPLVLWEPTGVGKTLLARGLAQRWRQSRPEANASQAKVVVLTGADFARSHAQAVQTDTLADHRARLLKAKLLVLDGLEELAKKPTAQQELVHTLDAALAEENCVLVATREPLSPGGAFLPALASRLSAGLVVPLTTPGAAARRVLVERIIGAHGVDMTPQAVALLADELPGTADELRHAVLQLCESDGNGDAGLIDETAVHSFLDQQNEHRRPK